MRKQARIAFALSVVGGLTAFACLILREREPTYDGRNLNFWLETYQEELRPSHISDLRPAVPDYLGGKTALRATGTNAIPTLLRMAGKKDSALKIKILALLAQQSVIKLQTRPAAYQHYLAALGFRALGPEAKSAVPGLIRLLSDEDIEIRATAAEALQWIGPDAREAVGALALCLESDVYPDESEHAGSALLEVSRDPALFVSALVRRLKGPAASAPERFSILMTLGQMGPSATGAVPGIMPFLKGQDFKVRVVATNSLYLIAPAAAIKAGVNPLDIPPESPPPTNIDQFHFDLRIRQ